MSLSAHGTGRTSSTFADDARGAAPTDPISVPDVAQRLIALAAEDERLTREALALPGAAHRREAVGQCRADHARLLRDFVEASGWPSCSAVGEEASIAALRILLHSSDLDFMLTCSGLIASAVKSNASPPIHLAYVEDACAVLQGRRQKYGTQIDHALLRPYPIQDPEGLGDRRSAVGLPPLREVIDHHLDLLRQAR